MLFIRHFHVDYFILLQIDSHFGKWMFSLGGHDVLRWEGLAGFGRQSPGLDWGGRRLCDLELGYAARAVLANDSMIKCHWLHLRLLIDLHAVGVQVLKSSHCLIVFLGCVLVNQVFSLVFKFGKLLLESLRRLCIIILGTPRACHGQFLAWSSCRCKLLQRRRNLVIRKLGCRLVVRRHNWWLSRCTSSSLQSCLLEINSSYACLTDLRLIEGTWLAHRHVWDRSYAGDTLVDRFDWPRESNGRDRLSSLELQLKLALLDIL